MSFISENEGYDFFKLGLDILKKIPKNKSFCFSVPNLYNSLAMIEMSKAGNCHDEISSFLQEDIHSGSIIARKGLLESTKDFYKLYFYLDSKENKINEIDKQNLENENLNVNSEDKENINLENKEILHLSPKLEYILNQKSQHSPILRMDLFDLVDDLQEDMTEYIMNDFLESENEALKTKIRVESLKDESILDEVPAQKSRQNSFEEYKIHDNIFDVPKNHIDDRYKRNKIVFDPASLEIVKNKIDNLDSFQKTALKNYYYESLFVHDIKYNPENFDGKNKSENQFYAAILSKTNPTEEYAVKIKEDLYSMILNISSIENDQILKNITDSHQNSHNKEFLKKRFNLDFLNKNQKLLQYSLHFYKNVFPFKPKINFNQEFYIPYGPARKVKFLNLKNIFLFSQDNNLKCRFVMIPTSNSALNVIFLLPHQDSNIENLSHDINVNFV